MSEVSAETRGILLKITEDEWRSYYRELVIYAYARCKRWLWHSRNTENLPMGYSPETITQEAVTRLFDGSRAWNHQLYSEDSPIPFLKGVIDSLIWALLSGADHQRTVPLETDNATGDGDQRGISQSIDSEAGLSHSSNLPIEKKIYLEGVERRIRIAIGDRSDLIEFFEYLLEGLKPREISARMNTDVKHVYALRKTFDRRTAEIQSELFGMKQIEGAMKEGRR
jgi:hypothetical protein